MLGNGLLAILVPVKGQSIGFNNATIGLVMSAYFMGMLLGSYITPKIIAHVGHIRVFAALASVASISALIFPAYEVTWVWAFLRLCFGFAYAGMYVVCESWLNDRVTNVNRGQILGLYVVIVMGAYGAGAQLLRIGDPTSFTLFSLISIMISVAVMPILITEKHAPSFEAPEAMSLIQMYKTSPAGVVVMALFGISGGICYSMAPSYALQSDFSVSEAANFTAVYSFGGLLFTWPLGRWSDFTDRRYIMIGSASVVIIASFIALFAGWQHSFLILLAAHFVIGGFSTAIYPLVTSHVNDLLKPSQIVAASSCLLFIYSLASTVGANLSGITMQFVGPSAYFIGVIMAHGGIIGFVLWRVYKRRISLQNRPLFNFLGPRNSAVLAQVYAKARGLTGND